MTTGQACQEDREAAHALKLADEWKRGENTEQWPVSHAQAMLALGHLCALIDANVDESPTYLLEKLTAMVRL